ncbi:MAG: acyltransferase family protein, partial [Myxococcota bacterium]
MLERSHRKLEVDLLKALGILAVVVIHSLRDFWNPDFTASELWIGQLMRFGVPAFLAVSGFLYAVPQATWSSVGPRLRRILLPYLFASSIAIALSLWLGGL